jgi:hypothetical protein
MFEILAFGLPSRLKVDYSRQGFSRIKIQDPACLTRISMKGYVDGIVRQVII